MQKYEEARSPSTSTKKVLELSKPSIQKIGEEFYWIAGSEEVFLLNTKRSTNGQDYAKKLRAEEILTLPIDLVYVGDEGPHYLDDEEEAFTKLVKIIENMNMMRT